MATGASTASLAIILIDARYGVQVQTRRHSFICALLGIRHFVIAVNKMDLVQFSQERFDHITQDYLHFADKLGVRDIRFVPLSALTGDNVARPSEHTPWYQGLPLLEILETLEIDRDDNLTDLRFPVQYVNRPHLDFRGYCGTLAAGTIRPGQKIKVLPSGKLATVKSILTWEGELNLATAGDAITLTLQEEIDISRGDILVAAEQHTHLGRAFAADLVWMHDQPLDIGKRYDFKLGTSFSGGRIRAIDYQIDVNSLEQHPAQQLPLNGIARVEIELDNPLAFDEYQLCQATGSFVVIDRLSNVTIGAGMIRQPLLDSSLPLQHTHTNTPFEQDLKALIQKHFPHWWP